MILNKEGGLRRTLLHSLILLAAMVCMAPAAAPQQSPGSENYIGAEACGDCHAAQMEQFRKTAMAVLLSDKYPAEQRGCEGCHGPGGPHVEAIGEGRTGAEARIYNFARHTPKENAARCLSCHEKDQKQSLFHRSRHLGAGVSCVDCHLAHRLPDFEELAKPSPTADALFTLPQRSGEREWLDNRLTRQKQPDLCYSCHRGVEAEFRLPVRHRVSEGLVQCTDCHNPHGTLNPRELRSAGNEQCSVCHVEKQGPFVFEHAAVQVEGCTACHTPHGTTNLHLLKRRQERQLCLECHVSPDATPVPHPRLGFRAAGECTRCHVDIHGSNYQPQFLR